jgi:hypothetical protein
MHREISRLEEYIRKMEESCELVKQRAATFQY